MRDNLGDLLRRTGLLVISIVLIGFVVQDIMTRRDISFSLSAVSRLVPGNKPMHGTIVEDKQLNVTIVGQQQLNDTVKGEAQPKQPPEENKQLAAIPGIDEPLYFRGYGHRRIKKSRIGKLTMIYGDPSPVYERALVLQKQHNAKFGYNMFVLRTHTMPGYWSKPAYILKVLIDELEKPEATRLKWLVWVDADVVLMNSQIPLEIFLPDEQGPEINCLVTNDWNGLNNGIFFLRVSQWSVWLMSAVTATTVMDPKLKLRFSDQTALELQLARDQFIAQTRHVPQRWFNAYPGDRGSPDPVPSLPMLKYSASAIKEGDLFVHFPASREARPRRMDAWLNTAEQHEPPWAVPLNYTTYMKEIDLYWQNDAPKPKKVDADKKVGLHHKPEPHRKTSSPKHVNTPQEIDRHPRIDKKKAEAAKQIENDTARAPMKKVDFLTALRAHKKAKADRKIATLLESLKAEKKAEKRAEKRAVAHARSLPEMQQWGPEFTFEEF